MHQEFRTLSGGFIDRRKEISFIFNGKKYYGPSTLRTGLEKTRNLMTIRIAKDLGLKKIINFSKNLGIYDNPEELMSISLG